jgi:predicted transposase YbfD/YdcC
MGVKAMENKNQSEIEIVQELLDILDLKGVVFTFDTLQCQKKTLDIIAESGNEYVVKVNKNQPKLYQTIEKLAREQKPLKTYTEKEKTRDRESQRIVTVFSVPDPK